MHTAIYARTCRKEKQHNTTSIDNQIAFCKDLAREHGLTTEVDHVYTDVELEGRLPPTCWADDDEDSRPALSALIQRIEEGQISHVIVRRLEKLGTTSDVLLAIMEVLVAHDVWVVGSRSQLTDNIDPSSAFAFSILKSRVCFDNPAERDRKQQEISKLRDEISRLHERIGRLESEIAELES